MALKASNTQDQVLLGTWEARSSFSYFFLFRNLKFMSVVLGLRPDSTKTVLSGCSGSGVLYLQQ